MHRLLLLAAAGLLGWVSVLPLSAQSLAASRAYLESPTDDSFESGIGLIRGWVCEATAVEVQLDDGERWVAAYGTKREDTAGICGDTDNGFGLTFNWNRLGDGPHTLRAFADGAEFAKVTFNVTTLGQEYLRGASGQSSLPGFPLPADNVAVHWSETHQNFVIADAQANTCSNLEVQPSVSEPPAISTPAYLESPGTGSCESGIGLIRGWVCEAATVEVQMDDGERWLTAYGTKREDTAGVCGDTNNGFGLTFNWNRLGDGPHTLRAFADGVEFAAVTFRVTTLGREYLRGAGGTYSLAGFPAPEQSILLSWQESHQNFMISDSSRRQEAGQGALDHYVAKPDPSYAFHQERTERGAGYDAYVLKMSSQQWRTASEVDRVLWEHDVLVTVPWVVHSNSPHTAILLIDGGDNGKPPSSESIQLIGAVAVSLGSVVAVIRQVPNQPLRFADEIDRPRKEDAILAYSMDKYLLSGDPEWPVQVAMTKAAVRAMDTVQDFLASRRRIDDFIVMGGSKRGWTTWLTAAVDHRVKAIAPASIDMLNLERQFIHHWEAYGFYALALADYVEFNLPCRMQTPEGQSLLRIIDPYQYRVRYTMPKLILNSAGDQFFVSDSSRFYYAALPVPKWLRYSPNTDHGQDADVLLAALSWIDDINDGKTSPQYGWIEQTDGSIQVQTASEPKQVRVWQASNPDARDFRLETIGSAWNAMDIQTNGNGIYTGFIPQPAQGSTAFLVELSYESSGLETDQTFTTGIRVLPDSLPYKGSACLGQ